MSIPASINRSVNKGRKARKGARGQANALTTSSRNKNILTSMVEPWMPLFPARISKRLRYSTNFALTTTAGAVTTYVFRANDLFDPDFTGSGHQPMGFDQLMVFYNHFCVVEAKITATFKSYGSVDQTVCIRQDATSTPLTVIDRILEFGGLVTANILGSTDIGGCINLDLGLSVPKLQGVSENAVTADPSLRGDAATSPTEITYFHVQAWDAVGNGSTTQVSIILEQLAFFMEPRDATESFKLKARREEVKTDVRACDPDSVLIVNACGCDTKTKPSTSRGRTVL